MAGELFDNRLFESSRMILSEQRESWLEAARETTGLRKANARSAGVGGNISPIERVLSPTHTHQSQSL